MAEKDNDVLLAFTPKSLMFVQQRVARLARAPSQLTARLAVRSAALYLAERVRVRSSLHVVAAAAVSRIFNGKFYRARSRFHRNEILLENMRLKALAEIYTMHSFAQRCNLNFLFKNWQKFTNFAYFNKN